MTIRAPSWGGQIVFNERQTRIEAEAVAYGNKILDFRVSRGLSASYYPCCCRLRCACCCWGSCVQSALWITVDCRIEAVSKKHLRPRSVISMKRIDIHKVVEKAQGWSQLKTLGRLANSRLLDE